MSFEVTEHFVKQYSANVVHLSQQKGSRLLDKTRVEQITGKEAYFDRIGAVAAIKKTSRHSDTPQLDTPHSRRKVVLTDYQWADLIDNEDKLRMLNDPTSDYAQAAAWAMGRSIDDEIIEAGFGTAYAGEEGDVAVAFPNARKIHSVTTGGALGPLNLGALLLSQRLFDDADVDEDIPRFHAISSAQKQSLLSTTEVQSAEYNTVKALVQGQIDSFMGFKFIRTNRQPKDVAGTAKFSTTTGRYDGSGGTQATGSQMSLAWAMGGLLTGIGQSPLGKISERADKSYSNQVYMRMSLGAVRMEEATVVHVYSKES